MRELWADLLACPVTEQEPSVSIVTNTRPRRPEDEARRDVLDLILQIPRLLLRSRGLSGTGSGRTPESLDTETMEEVKDARGLLSDRGQDEEDIMNSVSGPTQNE